MKKHILEFLMETNKPLTIQEIKSHFKIKNLEEILNQLVNEKKLTLKKNRYTVTKNIRGFLKFTNNGNAYVEINKNEKIFINQKNLLGANSGDLVSIEYIKSKNNQKEGKIVEIISSNKRNTVGEIVAKDKKLYVKYETKKEKIYIKIDEKVNNIVEGHKVVFQKGKLIEKNIYDGKIISIVGHKTDPSIDVITKAVTYGIDTKFSDEYMSLANNIPTKVSKDEKSGRLDLTNEEIFTIDGDSAKDFDDAVSVKKLDNGHYILGVHIAHVSHYVKENSIIDKIAFERGNSVYLANYVIPMLLHNLSNGICSLNENVDRLTKSCIMEFDEHGILVDYSIKDSVINSKKRMTYNKVNQVLNGNCPEDYKQFEKSLLIMNELAIKLRKVRIADGSVEFNIDEPEVIFNEKGKPIDIIVRNRADAEKLIEEFMLSANSAVGLHLFSKKLPAIFRIHDIPNIEKIKEFMNFLHVMGEKTSKIPHNLRPDFIQKILNSLKNNPSFKIYSELLLQSMSKAAYSIEKLEHFALALKIYTHFTAPIRRYADLIVHRLLDLYERPDFDRNKLKIRMLEKKLDEICKHASLKERNAEICEREVFKMYAAEFMESKIGVEYEGVIHALTEHGIYINIYNGVNGFLKCSNINKNKYSVIINDKEYKIGDKIKVKVINASKESSMIDLEVSEYEKVLKKFI